MHWPGWSPGASQVESALGVHAYWSVSCEPAPPADPHHVDGATICRTASVIGCRSGFKMPVGATGANAHSVVRQTRGVRTLPVSLHHTRIEPERQPSNERGGSSPSWTLLSSCFARACPLSNVIPPFDQGQANERPALARRVGQRPLVVGLGPIISPAPQPNQDAATSRLVTAFPSFSSPST